METVRLVTTNQQNIELVEEPWRAWPDFLQSVRWMHLLLQPSYTESFNNVTADGVTQGVASVVGFPISWVPDAWRACPDDAREVAQAGVRLLGDQEAVAEGHRHLVAHNDKAAELWRGWLNA